MRTASPFVLNVRELLESPGVQKPIAFAAPIELESGLVKIEGDLQLDLVLEAIEGGVLVRGEFAGSYAGSCRRCLKPIAGGFEVKGSEIYRPEGAEVWEEGYVVKDATVDLEPMIRDTVGLALPINPLCREACEGICPRCGADLNEGPCDCGPEVDHRWSALDDLKGELSG
jgi:DUF177 domain-containing protein